MTDTKPATDEQIERWAEQCRHGSTPQQGMALALIARIEKEQQWTEEAVTNANTLMGSNVALSGEIATLRAKLAKAEVALESWLALNMQTTKPGELLRWRSQTHQALAAIREGEKHHD